MRFVSDDRKVESKSPCMKVIAAGLSRCATSSLQAALESDVLGYEPCMHMAHIAPHADREKLILAALQETNPKERQKILHKVFDGYQATSDYPGWIFTDDLMDMYPDAIVILNQRQSAEAWLESIGQSLQFFGTMWYYVPTFLWQTDRLHYWLHIYGYERLKERFPNITGLYTTQFYHLHNEWVREEAKKRGRKVVEWYPSDGWNPVCEALGKAPPKDGRPFPRLNDSAQMKMVKRILVGRGLISWALLGGALWAGWTYGPGLIREYL